MTSRSRSDEAEDDRWGHAELERVIVMMWIVFCLFVCSFVRLFACLFCLIVFDCLIVFECLIMFDVFRF